MGKNPTFNSRTEHFQLQFCSTVWKLYTLIGLAGKEGKMSLVQVTNNKT